MFRRREEKQKRVEETKSKSREYEGGLWMERTMAYNRAREQESVVSPSVCVECVCV